MRYQFKCRNCSEVMKVLIVLAVIEFASGKEINFYIPLTLFINYKIVHKIVSYALNQIYIFFPQRLQSAGESWVVKMLKKNRCPIKFHFEMLKTNISVEEQLLTIIGF